MKVSISVQEMLNWFHLKSKILFPNNQTIINIILISFTSCKKFLGTISKPELSKLKSEMNLLMDTYIIIPGYLNDLAMKLKKMIDFYILVCFNFLSN